MRAWILTDGKIGDRVQCLGVARRLQADIEERVLAPGKPWTWLMPRGPVPFRDRHTRHDSPIAPPFPDIAIASGRRAVPYLRSLRKVSNGRTFTVFLKDPRIAPDFADLVWVPRHDRLRGPNVLVSDTAPHNLQLHEIKAATENRPRVWDSLPGPRLGMMIGNPLSGARNAQDALDVFLRQVDRALDQVGSIIITPSRRSPASLMAALKERLNGFPHWIWDGIGDNPYQAILGFADMLAVTADSHNMVSEALFTGKPVFPVMTGNLNPKLARFLAHIRDDGFVRPFEGTLEPYDYQPVDTTAVIADAILEKLSHR